MDFEGILDEGEGYEPTNEEVEQAYNYYEAAKALPAIISQTAVFKQSVKEQILNGYLNPLEFYRQVKIVSEALEELKKDPDIFDCAYQERERFGKEKAKVNGAVFEIQQRSTPDYKTCGDSVWNELKEKISAREKYLKALPPEGGVNPDTGEIIKPPVVSISSYVKVNL